MRLGLFGGTFDPIHAGHLAAAQAALVSLELDEVLFVAAGQPWLKSGLPVTDAGHRLAMVELAIVSRPGFRASDIEVQRPGPSYTVDTVEELAAAAVEPTELYVLVGLDALNEIAAWQRPERVLERSTVVGIARPGSQEFDRAAVDGVRAGASADVVVVRGPLVDVSSTEVRLRVRGGLSIEGLVPGPVIEYIGRHGLYQEGLDGRDATMDGSEADAILRHAKGIGALKFGEFRLSAGGLSSYYFDGRIVTLDPEGAYRVATAFYPILRDCGAEAIAGPTVGADPIVASVATISHLKGHPIPGLIVRKETKEHGAQRMIEGSLKPGAKVAVVDDTCSSGGSLLHAIDAIEEAGCRVVKVLCILDRHLGGSDEIRRRGYDFLALLEADEDGRIVPTEGGSPSGDGGPR